MRIPLLHHGEHDPADVVRVVNAPMLEDRASHGAEALERQLPDALGQLAARDVARLFERLDDPMKRLQHEDVRARVKARVALLESIQDLVGELQVGHTRKCEGLSGRSPGVEP